MEERRRQREREAQREDEERNRAGMTWTPIQRDQRCFRYGTRRYWAKLENIPRGFNHIRECRIMKASINGRMVTPTYCDDKGGVVVGTWEIDFGEGDCAPIWSNIWQKDCTAPGSGLRVLEAKLQNVHSDDDALVMCKSTPLDLRGEHYEGPMSCANWGGWQMFGYWNIRDDECW
ncbi:hypothetical protein BDQ12DRAFT_701200 [Crucibulum laeve]|uniref:Cyanovirin-N domain-containing protein n=1 Tax=Crucibulum laeve TaxID=68775 RepID=A0A5C3LIE3_9AGAR|nr:hypothetical protein BDQ12DRAFT_701200 [Crucibulum laeve]